MALIRLEEDVYTAQAKLVSVPVKAVVTTAVARFVSEVEAASANLAQWQGMIAKSHLQCELVSQGENDHLTLL